MKAKFLAGMLGAALVFTGCVDTVGGRKTAGVPWVKDRVEGRYERSVNKVYEAAKDVIVSTGTLVNETILHGDTNLVKTIEAKVETRTVWVRVVPIDQKVTSIVVQARTKAGGTDIEMAHEIEKQIALRLVTK